MSADGVFTAAVLTVSDTRSAGTRSDETTTLVADVLGAAEFDVVATRLVPDEQDQIETALIELAEIADLVLSTGGTGLAPRDVTPEATLAVIDRLVPGLPEAMRSQTSRVTPLAYVSRAVAGLRGSTLIVNMPGSPKGCRECLEVLLPMLPHALSTAAGPARVRDPHA